MPRTCVSRCSCTELWSSANRWTMCCLPYAKLKWKEHLYQSELALSKHDSTIYIHYTSIQYSNILFYAVCMQTAIMLTLCWGKVKHLYQLKLYRTTHRQARHNARQQCYHYIHTPTVNQYAVIDVNYSAVNTQLGALMIPSPTTIRQVNVETQSSTLSDLSFALQPKTNFEAPIQAARIVECLEITGVGCNLKQFEDLIWLTLTPHILRQIRPLRGRQPKRGGYNYCLRLA